MDSRDSSECQELPAVTFADGIQNSLVALSKVNIKVLSLTQKTLCETTSHKSTTALNILAI